MSDTLREALASALGILREIDKWITSGCQFAAQDIARKEIRRIESAYAANPAPPEAGLLFDILAIAAAVRNRRVPEDAYTYGVHGEVFNTLCAFIEHQPMDGLDDLLSEGREYLDRELPAMRAALARRDGWKCKARNNGTDPPQDCDWPICGCDPYADKVIEALEESGLLPDLP